MTKNISLGRGTKADPWVLKTPSWKSEYQIYKEKSADPPTLVCIVGKTVISYQSRCLEDLQAMLLKHGDWMFLGSADEGKPVKEETVEAWARSADNPVGGWYGLKKGCAAGSPITSRRLWNTWVLLKWSITQETTVCAQFNLIFADSNKFLY